MGDQRYFIASVVLQKQEIGRTLTTSTLSHHLAASEDEMRGIAVAFAMKERPDFCIVQILVNELNIPAIAATLTQKAHPDE